MNVQCKRARPKFRSNVNYDCVHVKRDQLFNSKVMEIYLRQTQKPWTHYMHFTAEQPTLFLSRNAHGMQFLKCIKELIEKCIILCSWNFESILLPFTSQSQRYFDPERMKIHTPELTCNKDTPSHEKECNSIKLNYNLTILE